MGDLSVVGSVQKLSAEFCAAHPRLDLLLLNANSLTQAHTRAVDGVEANWAIGCLGRALLLWSLEERLRAAPIPHVLTVVSLNFERIDFDDPSTFKGFSSSGPCSSSRASETVAPPRLPSTSICPAS